MRNNVINKIKNFCIIIVLSVIAFTLFSCPVDDTPKVVVNAPDILPNIGIDSSIGRFIIDISDSPDPEAAKREFQLFSVTPILTGFSFNTEEITIDGSPLISTILGVEVTTTISKADGIYTFSGTFQDGYYTLTYNEPEKTFNFVHEFYFKDTSGVLSQNNGPTQAYLRTEMSNVSIGEDLSYHSKMDVKVVSYLEEFPISTVFIWTEDNAECYSGPDNTSGNWIIGGYLKSSGKRINDMENQNYTFIPTAANFSDARALCNTLLADSTVSGGNEYLLVLDTTTNIISDLSIYEGVGTQPITAPIPWEIFP